MMNNIEKVNNFWNENLQSHFKDVSLLVKNNNTLDKIFGEYFGIKIKNFVIGRILIKFNDTKFNLLEIIYVILHELGHHY